MNGQKNIFMSIRKEEINSAMRLNGKYTVGEGNKSFLKRRAPHYEKEYGSFITLLILYSRDEDKRFFDI